MDPSPSPVPSSSVVPELLNLRRSPVLLSFTGPRTSLAHQSGSQFLCRSPVTEPTSFTGPRTCLAHQSGSQFLCRSRVHAPMSFPVLRFVSPASVLHSSVTSRSSSPYAHESMDLSRSPFPTSSVLHQFPVGVRCVYMGVLYVPTSLTSYSIPPSLT
jgi:hypothetical protein